jgi:hypothetical protein
MLDQKQLSQFSPTGKLFVALFTTLMLAVCLWAVWIYTVERGGVDEDHLPAYLIDESEETAQTPEQEIETVETHQPEEDENRMEHNLGLAHVHINGQTLLFFALGAVFLFTSVSRRVKKTALWAFAGTIVLHTVGLTGEGYHWVFDDMLAISGVLMLLIIAYMCLRIYVDLGRKRKATE